MLLLTLSAVLTAADPVIGTALLLSTPISIDGRLDEADWARARALGPLTQSEPEEGVPPSEETDVRVLFDRGTVYFGVRCFDRTPSQIVATQLARDADLDVDDRIVVLIDPLLDSRNGYFFEVNPSGARTDGQVFNNSEHPSQDWDGIWEARATIDATGWIVEIAIPMKTIRANPAQSVWGLNVERHLKRRQEVNRWASARRDVWFTNLAEAGRLEGITDIRRGLGLDVRPYVTGSRDTGDSRIEAGVDVFKTLSRNLSSWITVNTDFAETEVDERQVNLTRFPLFFPEKRSFFLEGAGIYEVAGLTGGRDVLPFFSRRIGLLEGQEVPILAGGKVIGQQSGWNTAFLDVETDAVDALSLERQNLLAARVSRNLFKQSWIGAVATRGNPAGTGGNYLVGADARFATSTFRGGKNLSLDLWMLRTDDEATLTQDYAAGFKLDYPNDLWDVALNFKHIGDEFRPALGFVPRRGIRKANLGVSFMPRPGRFGIRQWFFEFRPDYISNLEGRVQNWRIFTAPVNFRTESGEHIEWNFIPEYEHLDEPFEIEDGVVIAPGSYRTTRYRVEASTASKRPWEVDLELSWGGFYTGSLRSYSIELALKPNTHFAVAVGTEQNDVRLDEGEFVTRIWTLQAEYNHSSDVSLSSLVQYDSESRLLGLQSRLRWTVRPGGDLFLVFNRGWLRDLSGGFLPSFDRASVKVQYTFRL